VFGGGGSVQLGFAARGHGAAQLNRIIGTLVKLVAA
jgi:hypothetical protein